MAQGKNIYIGANPGKKHSQSNDTNSIPPPIDAAAQQCYHAVIKLLKQQDYEQAKKICQKGLKNSPSEYALLHLNVIIAAQLNDWQTVVKLYTQIMDKDAEQPMLYVNRAQAQIQLQQYVAAAADLKHALQLNYHCEPAQYMLAKLFLKQGNVQLATQHYQQLLKINPKHIEALCDLAALLHHSGQTQTALKYLLQARQVEPTSSHVLFHLIQMLVDCNQLQQATQILEKTVEQHPDYAVGFENLGHLYNLQGRYSEAEKACLKALDKNPKLVGSYLKLATALLEQEDFYGAIHWLDIANELFPHHPDVLHKLGYCNMKMNQFKLADKHYSDALKASPDKADTHLNYAISLLSQGKFKLGWSEYEWRVYDDGYKHRDRKFDRPQWQGENLKNKTIFIYTEQGFGDSIQFMRYTDKIKSAGGTVIVEIQKPLYRLFKDYPAIDKLLVRGEALPEHDYRIPILSLPGAFNTTLKTIPKLEHDLIIEDEITKKWQQIMPTNKKKKIGFVWAGSPTHKNDRRRTVELSYFLSLTNLKNTSWYSLQKHRDINPITGIQQVTPVIDLAPHIDGFSDTAAAIMQLDLVITVDTSVAHLAGVLHKPVWVLLAFNPDWRWLIDRDDSPWYPSMRLIRQPSPGDWESVFEIIRNELKYNKQPRG